MIETDYDIAVVGAGMAGASVAAELSKRHRVIVVEREDQPGYHSTGRSAALFSEIYGNDVVRALSRASRQFLFDPAVGFTETPLVRPRGTMFVARQDQLQALERFAALQDVAPAVKMLSGPEARTLCPILKEGYAAAAVYESQSVDVEVHQLHSSYLRQLKNSGGSLFLDARNLEIRRNGAGWELVAAGRTIRASIIVNAAGAWADEVAQQAGVQGLGMKPCKRTAVLVEPHYPGDLSILPLVLDIDEQFYFKPDAGLLLLSPADETPSEPADVYADELDIAIAIDRVSKTTNLNIQRVKHSWAGLRTFVSDRSPVAGFSDESRNFFWLAGQGGYGIQTAPALARAAAALIAGKALPDDLLELGVREANLSPHRLLAPVGP